MVAHTDERLETDSQSLITANFNGYEKDREVFKDYYIFVYIQCIILIFLGKRKIHSIIKKGTWTWLFKFYLISYFLYRRSVPYADHEFFHFPLHIFHKSKFISFTHLFSSHLLRLQHSIIQSQEKCSRVQQTNLSFS